MKTLECYRIIEITQFGEDHGVNDKWPIMGSRLEKNCDHLGDRWIVYPKGTYHDDDLDVIIVELVNEVDPSRKITTIDPGFIHPDIETTELPVHLVLRADNVNPIEGGQRAVINGYEVWVEEEDPLAIAILCNQVIMYDYTPPPEPAC